MALNASLGRSESAINYIAINAYAICRNVIFKENIGRWITGQTDQVAPCQ